MKKRFCVITILGFATLGNAQISLGSVINSDTKGTKDFTISDTEFVYYTQVFDKCIDDNTLLASAENTFSKRFSKSRNDFQNLNETTNSKTQLISNTNFNKFKISDFGTKFFETDLVIKKANLDYKLLKKYFISESTNGICTPSLLETNQKENLIFIPELYKDKKHNGYIVKVDKNGHCEETKIFTHENQGYYAFWGKEYLGHPTLYHYNFDTFQLMRIHKENDQWINHNVMPIYPNEMIDLYKQQLQKPEQEQLTQQFGYDFEIQKDGVYQILFLKNEWEQSNNTKEKEIYEKENPAPIFTDLSTIGNIQIKKVEDFDYSNPMIPVYCEGDDLTYANPKPTKLWKTVPGSEIIIPNMPAYKTQDTIGECRAFSLRTLLQKYTCDEWPKDAPDCKNPPEDLDISSFGMMMYTHTTKDTNKTFAPDAEERNMMYDIINNIMNSGDELILDSCKPFDRMVNSFSVDGHPNIALKEKFFAKLKKMYDTGRSNTEAAIADCPECLNEMNQQAGLNANLSNLKAALSKDSYDKFLFDLFFKDCKLASFPPGLTQAVYPTDEIKATPLMIKSRIIEGLKKGKPVLTPRVCVIPKSPSDCTDGGHSMVVSGYKQVCDATKKCKDLFRIHNSWGADWQQHNNDGWLDADLYTQNFIIEKNRISSGSVIWLEP